MLKQILKKLGLGSKSIDTKEKDFELLYRHRLRRGNESSPPPLKLTRKAGIFLAFMGLLFLPFGPVAFASSGISLSAFSGPPGTISVSGWGFDNGEVVSIYFTSATGSPVAQAVAAADSQFGPTSVTIPANAPQGSLPILAVGNNGHTGNNSYYVVQFTPSLTAASSPNTPGSIVGISGQGYAPGESIDLSINGTSGGTATADSHGSFTNANFLIPNLSAGTYQLHGTGKSSGADAIAYFYIGGFYASAYPSTYYLLPGQALSFSGQGFAPGETIQVFMDNGSQPATSFTAAGDGSFTNAGSIVIPVNTVAGAHMFKLHGVVSGGEASMMVTIGSFNGQISPSAFFAQPGDAVTFSGNGFAAGETINEFVDSSSTPAVTFAADKAGSFAAAGSFTIPFNFAGATHLFTLTGSSSHTSASVSIGVSGFFPSISPSSYYVTPGQQFTINGSGFAANENIAVALSGGATVTIAADKTGSFTAAGPFTAPFSGRSLHLTATGQSSGVSASIDISLGQLYPNASPDNYYVHAGSPITFSGSGFAPNETVSLSDGKTTIKTFAADAQGAFNNQTVSTPFSANDVSITYTFTGKSSGGTATVTVTVAAVHPIVSADNYYVTPGTTVHITGTGFSGNEPVAVSLGGTTASSTTDSSGTASSVPIIIPFNLSGSTVIVTMTGGLSGGSGSTTITLAPFYPSVTPSTWYTPPGSKIDVTGTGFAPAETVDANLNNSSLGKAAADAAGTVKFTQITIPLTATTAHFVLTGESSKASASVDVQLAGFSPQITPSAWYVAGGSPLSFSGTGFAPGESVQIKFNVASSTTITVTNDGTFTAGPFMVPFSATNVTTVFTSSVTNFSQTFNIGVAALSPSIWLSDYYDVGGSPLTVFGGGFGGNESIHITFGGALLGNVTADAAGNFTFKSQVPYGTAGNKTIVARGQSSGAQASAQFTQPQIYVNVQLGSYAGAPGDAATFIGSGFLPNEPVQITTDRTGTSPVYTLSADKSGNFNDSSWHVPVSFTGGPLTITIFGTQSFATESIIYWVTGP